MFRHRCSERLFEPVWCFQNGFHQSRDSEIPRCYRFRSLRALARPAPHYEAVASWAKIFVATKPLDWMKWNYWIWWNWLCRSWNSRSNRTIHLKCSTYCRDRHCQVIGHQLLPSSTDGHWMPLRRLLVSIWNCCVHLIDFVGSHDRPRHGSSHHLPIVPLLKFNFVIKLTSN